MSGSPRADADGVDEPLAAVVERERPRLRSFIRRQVRNVSDAEEVLEAVLFAPVQANWLLRPFEHVTGWLFRVARNRITDLCDAQTS